ncbi:hypothetical protein TSMEX_005758 [Taenia solium]|eukprot:TsM_000312600 transcript=TsM_000312600 gene=TsM_000312600
MQLSFTLSLSPQSFPEPSLQAAPCLVTSGCSSGSIVVYNSSHYLPSPPVRLLSVLYKCMNPTWFLPLSIPSSPR